MRSRPLNQRLRRSLERWCAFFLGVVLLTLGAQAESVILTLRNGDRLTGELKSENSERVVLKTPYAGTVKVPKAEIAKREPLNPPAPTPAPVPAPAPKPAPAPAPVPAPTAAKPASTNATPAVAVTTNAPAKPFFSYLIPDWFRPYTTNWHGSVQLGMDLGFGTSDRQTFYGNAYANHAYNRIRNNLEYHAAYGMLNSIESANRMNGRIKTDFDFGTKRRVYVYNTGGMGYDEIRRVDMEFDEGVGLGYKLIQRPKLNVNGELGAQYQDIDFATGEDRAYVSIRVAESLTWQVSDKLRIEQRLTFLPNLEELSDYRVRFELSTSYPLFKHITISLNAIELYDSKPPPGVDNNDLTIQATVGLTF